MVSEGYYCLLMIDCELLPTYHLLMRVSWAVVTVMSGDVDRMLL